MKETDLTRLARKTGLKPAQLKKLKALGLCIFAAAAAGCVKNAKIAIPPEQIRPPQAEDAAQQKTEISTGAIKPHQSGFWENYPAGTRYYTVSVKDFR